MPELREEGQELTSLHRKHKGYKKTGFDAFESRSVVKFLKDHEIDTLDICGLYSEFCVCETVRSAISRGYKVRVKNRLVIASDGTRSTGIETLRKMGAKITL